MGLPGSGKTTLALALAPLLNAVHFDADPVRININKDLRFSEEDRLEQARRMGWLCDTVTDAGGYAIASFVCPTPRTREQFGESIIVWCDRIHEGRFADTNKIFIPPDKYHFRVTAEGAPEAWASKIFSTIVPVFNPKKPTALFLGRYQPFHAGHKALIEEGLQRVGQVCIAVRDTQGTDEKNPFNFQFVKARIESAMREHAGKFIVVEVPNITNIYYGRDVGYKIEELVMPDAVQAISASKTRAAMYLEKFNPVFM
jgi:cytidyltransferase-like protein